MRKILTCIFMILSLYGFSSEILEKRLKELNTVYSFKKIETIGSFNECYEILIEQPINHDNPEQGTFQQKVYLSHKNFNQPTVFLINGYISHSNTVNEWSELLDANQIYVEHRYFGQSKPKEIVWETLNLKNACTDLHKIRMLFKEIYPGKWISTGISKGGLTAVSYNYFFPNDINATIALSASIKTECDTSFFAYIDSLSAEFGCLKELKEFQKQLLINKDKVLPLLQEHFKTANKKHEYLGLTRIFETAVLEIPFSIWQNNHGCKTVQDFETGTIDNLFKSFRKAIHDWFLTDDVFNDIDAYHYQAMTELGYYCYPTSEFKEYLINGTEVYASVIQPKQTTVKFSNELMKNIKEWLT
ncbi:MAG: hypothetical protein M3Q58_02575 [Bacteroidota bacterium]|nr:hypothetical protein [Bacteroidota bacterium]